MTPRYRRSSVRAVLEAAVTDHALTKPIHDALWAALWNRRYDDVDEPVWLPDSAYTGLVALARALDEQSAILGVDTGESFVVFRIAGTVPPIGSHVRVVPGSRDHWRLSDVQPLGLGIELDLSERSGTPELGWVATLREAVARLRTVFEDGHRRLAARRAQLGALQEVHSPEEVWRDRVAAITERVQLETELTPQEHTALAKARARGARSADEEGRRLTTARKRRFTERANAEVAHFRETEWPALRDRTQAEHQRYAEYRGEVVRLEAALSRVRNLAERAARAGGLLDAIEAAELRVSGMRLEGGRLEEPPYAEEVLRTIELLEATIPKGSGSTASSFSAYRAPTAGPSVIPPRF